MAVKGGRKKDDVRGKNKAGEGGKIKAHKLGRKKDLELGKKQDAIGGKKKGGSRSIVVGSVRRSSRIQSIFKQPKNKKS